MKKQGFSEDGELVSKVLIKISIRTWSQAESGRRDAASHLHVSFVLEQGCFWKLAGDTNQFNGRMTIKTSYKEISPFGVGLPQPLHLIRWFSFSYLAFFVIIILGGGGLNIVWGPSQWAYSEQYYMNFQLGGAIHPRRGRNWKKGKMMLSCQHKGVGCPGEMLSVGWGRFKLQNSKSCWSLQSKFAHLTVMNSCYLHRKTLSGGRTGPCKRWWRLEHFLLYPFHICRTGWWGLGRFGFGTNAKWKAKMDY